MDEIGQILVKLRKGKQLSQEELAAASGVSQATISRLEKQEQTASIKTLAKLARALEVGLLELAPRETLDNGEVADDTFSAFCDNPFCSRNKLLLAPDKTCRVQWDSWQQYRSDAWSEANFCRSCGSELVKECPGCAKRLLDKGGRYCTRCGTKLTARPTQDEWKQITAQLKGSEEEDDDIPF
jgi:transcriptional regulator with XRE-family HTH domain